MVATRSATRAQKTNAEAQVAPKPTLKAPPKRAPKKPAAVKVEPEPEKPKRAATRKAAEAPKVVVREPKKPKVTKPKSTTTTRTTRVSKVTKAASTTVRRGPRRNAKATTSAITIPVDDLGGLPDSPSASDVNPLAEYPNYPSTPDVNPLGEFPQYPSTPAVNPLAEFPNYPSTPAVHPVQEHPSHHSTPAVESLQESSNLPSSPINYSKRPHYLSTPEDIQELPAQIKSASTRKRSYQSIAEDLQGTPTAHSAAKRSRLSMTEDVQDTPTAYSPGRLSSLFTPEALQEALQGTPTAHSTGKRSYQSMAEDAQGTPAAKRSRPSMAEDFQDTPTAYSPGRPSWLSTPEALQELPSEVKPGLSLVAEPAFKALELKSAIRSPEKTSPKKTVAWTPNPYTGGFDSSFILPDGPLSDTLWFADIQSNGQSQNHLFVGLLEDLGARVVHRWNGENIGLTHVLFKDGNLSTLQNVAATNGAVKCVNLGFAIDCERKKERMNEADYAVDMDYKPPPIKTPGPRRFAQFTPGRTPGPVFNGSERGDESTELGTPSSDGSSIWTKTLLYDDDKENAAPTTCPPKSVCTPGALKWLNKSSPLKSSSVHSSTPRPNSSVKRKFEASGCLSAPPKKLRFN
jgi:hypothetical protein